MSPVVEALVVDAKLAKKLLATVRLVVEALASVVEPVTVSIAIEVVARVEVPRTLKSDATERLVVEAFPSTD